VVNNAGLIVGVETADGAGAFTVNGLSAGTYTVQVVGVSGAVIGTATATLTRAAMMAVVNVSATAAQLASAARAATGVTPADAPANRAAGVEPLRITTTAILSGLGAAASAVGTAALVANKTDASPSR
jgi:hypothetical protein